MTAAAVSNRVGAGASFHGGGLVTENANSPHLLAPKIKGRMYFGVAANDDAQQPDAKATTVYSWNLAVQRQIGKNWMVSATYLGTQTSHTHGRTPRRTQTARSA